MARTHDKGLFAEDAPSLGPAPTSAETSTHSVRAQERREEGTAALSEPGANRSAPREPKKRDTAAVNVRLPQSMLEAAHRAVDESPIEFSSVSDFIRRAVEHELRRRGLVRTYR